MNSGDERQDRPAASTDPGRPDADGGAQIPAADYHAIKALSAGMIWTMDSECPAKAFIDSPWNPRREPVNTTHFDIGTAAHLAVLEPHLLPERIVDHGFDDYRKTAAQQARDLAYAAGKTPLKPAEIATVDGIRKSLSEHHADVLFRKGQAEISLAWEWGGLACKCRPDYLSDDLSLVVDLKTAATANPRAVARKAFNEGWFVRAAWYLGGIQAATGTMPKSYLFVVVEKDAPYLAEVFELDVQALALGDKIIERTIPRIAECLRTGVWPSYGDGVTKLKLPSWQMAERESEFDG